ncbi:MAG TPA: hypothetical protein VFI99_10440 [Nocardioides sp.]|nr:hypothetical protein [Nocardioides sp.]
MRAILGAGLLLVSTTLVGAAATSAEAVTGCDVPTTTWVGPATEGGSASWNEPTNWSSGVPDATSAVCIPASTIGPHVLDGTQAEAGVVTLAGTLTVDSTLNVTALEGEFGELHGSGTTTVLDKIVGDGLTLLDAATVELPHEAVLGGELHVWDGSRLNVRGDAILEDGASIESFVGPEGPGYFTVAETGTLTLDSAGGSAGVYGGFTNHGAVHVLEGWLTMLGAGDEAPPGQFSDGSFTASPDATLTLAYTELRTGARIDNADVVDHIAVPAGNTATVSDSTVTFGPTESDLSLAGAGELRVTGNSVVSGRIGGSLTVTVPAGEVVRMGDAVVQDQARVRVDGELAQIGDILLQAQASLDVYGAHRAVHDGGLVHFSGADPGVEVIHPEGRLLCDEGSLLGMYTPVVNRGTVDSGNGLIVLAPDTDSPQPSSGTYRAGPSGTLVLGDAWDDRPDLVLDQATIEGQVLVGGVVRASGLQVRGRLETYPRSDTHPGGELVLAGTTTLADGASIDGNVTVGGQLQADLGPTGRASLSGAEVTGDVVAMSGTLSVPSLATSTLGEDGTLTEGQWRVWEGATLDLPAVTTLDTELYLLGGGASFGGGLATLTRIGPNGVLLTGGDDLAVPGPFRNEGFLVLNSGSRLDVGGKFRQLSTGTLYTYLDSAGHGQVRASGPRNLAGTLEVGRDPAYRPPVDTVLRFITSNGRVGRDDAFDKVISPPYGVRKLRVNYGEDRVRLWVDRVG